MQNKITVQRAYLGSTRVLVNSEGRAYAGVRGGWVNGIEGTIPVGQPYDSWSDVPYAWLGHVPYWRNRS